MCICAELYQHDSWLSQCQWEPDKLHAVGYLKWASTTSRTWVLVLVSVALWTRNRDKLWFVGHRAGVVHRPQGSCGPQTTEQVWFIGHKAGPPTQFNINNILIIFDERKFRGWNGLFPKLHPHQLIFGQQKFFFVCGVQNCLYSFTLFPYPLLTHSLSFLSVYVHVFINIYVSSKKSINSRKAPWG